MFKIVMICALIGFAAAKPIDGDAHAEVLSSKTDVRADGFTSGFETSNHIGREESGDEHGAIHGSFKWISPEGKEVEVHYVADENGYQPHSDWLPTPPPVPVEIERSLEYLRTHGEAPEHHH